MMMSYSRVCPRERAAGVFLWQKGWSRRQIATALGRSVSTAQAICRTAEEFYGTRHDCRRRCRQLREHLARAIKHRIPTVAQRINYFVAGWYNNVEEILLGPKQSRQAEQGEEEEPP